MLHHLPSGHPHPPKSMGRDTVFILLVSNLNGGASVLPHILPAYPPVLPYSLTYTVTSFVSTYIYLISLTFSLGHDEMATVWWLQKLVCDLNAIYFVSAIKEFILKWIQTKVVIYTSIEKVSLPHCKDCTWIFECFCPF